MSNPFVGEIRMFGGNFAPAGWAFCSGGLLPISENETLFNLIGTTYGGDGQSTFGLPDLQGRIPVHQGNGYTLADKAGSESVTMITQQLPVHTHAPAAQTGAGNQAGPGNGVWAFSNLAQFNNLPASANMLPQAILPSGGSQPHDNMMPFLAVSFIIALFGVYPPQS